VPFLLGAANNEGAFGRTGTAPSLQTGGGQGEIGDRGGGMLVGNGQFVVLPQVAYLLLDLGKQFHRGRQARIPGGGPDQFYRIVSAAGPDQFKDGAGL
jgi:hypothetical protein